MNKIAIFFMVIGGISFLALLTGVAYACIGGYRNLYWIIGSAVALVSSLVTSELFLSNEDYTD